MKSIHLILAGVCCGILVGTSIIAGAAEPNTLTDTGKNAGGKAGEDPALFSVRDGVKLDPPPAARQKPYAPADGQVVEVNPPPFIWVPAGRDAVYQLQVSPSENFPAGSTRTFSGLERSVHVPGEPLPAGRWFWRYGVETRSGPVFGRARPFTIPAAARPFPFPDFDAAVRRVPHDRPRLFFGGERLAQVRAAARGELKDAVRDLVQSCEKAIGEPLVAEPGYRPKEPGLGGRWHLNVMRTVLPPMRMMENCALAYLVTGDRRLGLEAKRRLLYFFSWDPEGPTSFFAYDEPPMWMMMCGTRAYDWTHDLFTPEERAKIEPNMKARALQFLKELQNPPFESNPYRSSHAARLPGFLGECALSFIHDWFKARPWLEYATLLYMTSYPAWGGDDGGWQEGAGYWRNYMTFAMHYVVALQQATGIDLMQKTFFRNTPNYALYTAMPYHEHSPFGDAQNEPPGSLGRVMYAFSTLTQNPHFRWYADAARYRPGADVLSLATYDPSLKPRSPLELPPARVFPSVGLVSMHTALGNASEDISLLLRSSPYGSVSHGHADQNAFAIEAFGRGLAIATGYYPWYGSPHHHDWMRATKAVNSVLVNGEGQVRRSWDAKGQITAFQSVEGYDYAEGEAGAAYGGRLDRFRRHVVHVRPGVFVIFDDLAAPKPATYQWLLHAYDRIEVDEQNRVLDIRREPAAMKTLLLLPADLSISQTDRYVPEPESTIGEWKNTWHLTASTTQPATAGQFLAVLMPHRAGREATLPQAVLVRGRGAIGARLSFPDGSEELIAFRTDAGAKTIECGGFESDGRVLARRRDKNGAVTRHLLLEGTTLSEKGRRIASTNLPAFWKSRLEDVEDSVRHVKKGRMSVLARTPGGRNVYLVAYGEREDRRGTANYNSAAGGRDPASYARKDGTQKPVVFLLGPVHGQEIEGVAGLLNLIQVAETGRDLRGRPWEQLAANLARCRVLIVPSGSPDARARCRYDSWVGEELATHNRIGMGTKPDGSNHVWPASKRIHPMRGPEVAVQGAYWNDAAINLMHDEWFDPMSPETMAFFRLAREEAPDFIVSLHSHAVPPSIEPTAYVPWTIKQSIAAFGDRLQRRYADAGLPHRPGGPKPVEDGMKFPPPSFNLASALHHACGGAAFVHETPCGFRTPPYPKVTHEQLLDIQMLLYDELLRFAVENPVNWKI